MALLFPVLVTRNEGVFTAETPALEDWSISGPDVGSLMTQARAALESALVDGLALANYTVVTRAGVEVHEVKIDEPESWWFKDPSE